MSEEEKESKGFVVRDRRRFDDQGNERQDGTEVKAQQLSSQAEAVRAQHASESPPQEESGEINFGSFVMSLATQALMQLGEIKPPPGMPLDVDIDAARQTIDIIAMLQTKTKGNLGKEEAHILEQILHNLRISYVKVSGASPVK